MLKLYLLLYRKIDLIIVVKKINTIFIKLAIFKRFNKMSDLNDDQPIINSNNNNDQSQNVSNKCLFQYSCLKFRIFNIYIIKIQATEP